MDAAFTGTGFTPATKLEVAQCVDEFLNGDLMQACAGARADVVDVDAAGTIDASYRLDRLIRRGGPTETDCKQVACSLVIFDNDTAIASVPTPWADEIAPPSPSLTIVGAQALDLADPRIEELTWGDHVIGEFVPAYDAGEYVLLTVKGAGFAPGENVILQTCTRPTTLDFGDDIAVVGEECGPGGADVTAKPNGTFRTTMLATTVLHRTSGEEADCLNGRECLLVTPWTQDGSATPMAALNLGFIAEFLN